jgi:hypothetical protein
MKTRIQVFVVRENNEVVSIQGLSDMYTESYCKYKREFISDDDVKEFCTSVWGKDTKQFERYIKYLNEDGNFSLQYEAKDMPSIGNVKVSIEYVEVEIN